MTNSLITSDKDVKNLTESLQVQEKDGIQSVSARELYKGLQISDRFSRWFESLLKYGFAENEDFCCVKTSTQQNQYGGTKEIDDYAISFDMAKQICMLQRSEQGRKYRIYLINLEKAWNSPEMVMKRALQIADKKVKEMEAKLLEQKPKVEYVDAYCDSENLEEIGHLGKVAKIGEIKIFKTLLKDGVIKERHSTDGIKCYDPCFGYEKYFETLHVPFLRGEKQLNRDKLMLNHKGFMYFRAKYATAETIVETAGKWLEKEGK